MKKKEKAAVIEADQEVVEVVDVPAPKAEKAEAHAVVPSLMWAYKCPKCGEASVMKSHGGEGKASKEKCAHCGAAVEVEYPK